MPIIILGFVNQTNNKGMLTIMKDTLLKGAVNAQLAVRDTASRARNLMTREGREDMERGDIVQTIIIIAMFVLICMVVGGILMAAIQGQAEKVGDCIENSNSGACRDFK